MVVWGMLLGTSGLRGCWSGILDVFLTLSGMKKGSRCLAVECSYAFFYVCEYSSLSGSEIASVAVWGSLVCILRVGRPILCWLNFVYTRLTRIQILFPDAVVYRHAKQVEVAPACYRIFVLDVWKIPCSMHDLVLNHATYFF